VTVARLIHGVVSSLLDMHELGVLHRDVKPENYLLASNDPCAPVKAIDFGLAARFAPSPPGGGRTLPLQGTAMFVAPECVADSRVGPESDMWSVGTCPPVAVEATARPFCRWG
jgi:calcium-dependent protein kinase